MAKTPEGHLVMQIIQYLKLKGHYCGKTKTMGVVRGGRFTRDPYLFKGFPDIVVFTPRLIFIEAKSPTGKQTPEQKTFQETCAKAGILYILARRFEDVEKVVK